jgi:hypothetical protein
VGQSFEWLHRDLLDRMKPDARRGIYQTKVSTIPSLLIGRGAVACLFKPFSDTAFLEALNVALGMR